MKKNIVCIFIIVSILKLSVMQADISDFYSINEVIGKGMYGKILKAVDFNNNNIVAVKMMDKAHLKKIYIFKYMEKFENERNAMRKCNHPNLIRYIDSFEDIENFYIVMDYVKHGTLYDLITEKERLSIIESKTIFSQLLSGIEYCHNVSLAHCDIKLENILVHDKENLVIKIADFGFATQIDEPEKLIKLYCGSIVYSAPEILKKKPCNLVKIDIWSMAVCLYILCTGYCPWRGTDAYTVIRNINSYSFRPQLVDNLSLRDLFSKIFVPHPERISIDQIKKHSWMIS